jgi:hypothetical protein
MAEAGEYLRELIIHKSLFRFKRQASSWTIATQYVTTIIPTTHISQKTVSTNGHSYQLGIQIKHRCTDRIIAQSRRLL